MDGKIDLTTLILMIVAVVLIFKLRSVLGKRSGGEETRYQRYETKAREQAAADSKDKIVTLPRRSTVEQPAAPPKPSEPQLERETAIRTFAGSNADIATGLLAIARADQAFEPVSFVAGSRAAYEMIVTAFAEGNRKVLKDLLSRDVFEGFSSAIGDRENRGELMDQSFVGIKSAEIIEAELKDRTANISVRFVSELISATRDRGGEVIHGDPKKISDVTDVWTFARDTNSRNPNWRVVGTQTAA